MGWSTSGEKNSADVTNSVDVDVTNGVNPIWYEYINKHDSTK